MKVTTPYERVTEVNNCRILSMYIQAGIGLGKIPYTLFNEKLTFKIGDEIHSVIDASSQNEATIKWVADNLRLLTIGTCFVAFDDALDDLLGPKPSTYLENDIDSLRAIVYMTRCAFAHNPASPVWQIHLRFQKFFKINEINLEIDFSRLNGKALAWSHYGDSQSMQKLIHHSMYVIKKYSDEAVKNESKSIISDLRNLGH